MGIAGFGAKLEQSLPIFEGCFNPEGFGRDDGRMEFGLGMDEVLLVTDAASDEVEDGAGGGAEASGIASCVSLIIITFFTNFFKVYTLR